MSEQTTMTTRQAASGHRTALILIACAISFLLGTQLSIEINETSALGYAVDASASIELPSSNSRGWHPVDVFYGDSSHLDRQVNGSLWTSQANQDHIVFNLLGKGGYFVDLAANDATYLSNTYALETHHGWNGLCIEANPKYWLGLAGRKCQVVGAVLGHQTMEEIQFRYGSKASGQKQGDRSDTGVLGGIVNPNFDNMEIDTLDDEVESRFTATLVDVFRRYKVPSLIDYLSLDVEGAEMYIMSSFPFDRHRIKIMTVERPKGDLIELLQTNGYVLLSQLSHWGETLWCHESIKSTLDLSNMTFPRPRGKRTRTIKFDEPGANELPW
jgi:hypothetical protein